MNTVTRALVGALVIVLARLTVKYMRQPKRGRAGRVSMPALLLVVGIIGTALFSAFAVMSAVSRAELWVSILLGGFALLCTLLILLFVNCRITYNDFGFVSGRLFGKKRTFTYMQVTAIAENPHETHIFVGEEKITVDEGAVGGERFVACVKERYRAIHDGQNIPTREHP